MGIRYRNRHSRRPSSAALAIVGVTIGLQSATLVQVTASDHAATDAQLLGAGGFERVIAESEQQASQPIKTAQALCPETKHVVSGGGSISGPGSGNIRLMLTRLEPVHLLDGVRDGYVVTAAETGSGFDGNWVVRAYVVCAPILAQIVSAFSDPSSASVQSAAAVCATDPRKSVIGTGARVGISNAGQGQVGLQVMRASGSGDIARAQAHEDANGYSGAWYVVSYAICSTTPVGYRIQTQRSFEDESENVKSAEAGCPVGTVLYGAGGATSNVAPGGVSLRKVFPDDADVAQVTAVETSPGISESWDFIVAQAICGQQVGT